MYWDTTSTATPVYYNYGTTTTTSPLWWLDTPLQDGTTIPGIVYDTILVPIDIGDSDEQDRVAELEELDEFLDEFRH